jgi:hypothetical protein
MSNKAEALALLALDGLSTDQRLHINVLTAAHSGFRVIQTQDGLRILHEEKLAYDAFGVTLRVAPLSPLPDYADSVDACLKLAVPDGYFWVMESQFKRDPYGAVLYKAFEKQETQAKHQSDVSLPVAMLKAWWALQED